MLGVELPDTSEHAERVLRLSGRLRFRDVKRLFDQIGGSVHGFDGEASTNQPKNCALWGGFTQFTLPPPNGRYPSRSLFFRGELAANLALCLGTEAAG